MSDQPDSRPVFTIVMGCNGVGKTAWKRCNRDRLPIPYFDQDSIAGGIGDWDSDVSRRRTRELVDAEILAAIKGRISYGIESTYSGNPGVFRVNQAIRAGYRIEGVYLGTSSPEINIRRINQRVLSQTGHKVDPARIPERYRYSLSNLRRTAGEFDELTILDNSNDDTLGIPDPIEQCFLERGEIRSKLPDEELATWAASWLHGLRQSIESKQRLQRKHDKAR